MARYMANQMGGKLEIYIWLQHTIDGSSLEIIVENCGKV